MQQLPKRDMKRMNNSDGPRPLHMTARRELLTQLLKLQEETGLQVISELERKESGARATEGSGFRKGYSGRYAASFA